MKKRKSKNKSYVELFIACVVISILILIFKLPNTLFFVLGAGFVINMIAIEIKNKDSN